jgi:MYXO-CTERM domain-containing protein
MGDGGLADGGDDGGGAGFGDASSKTGCSCRTTGANGPWSLVGLGVGVAALVARVVRRRKAR